MWFEKIWRGLRLDIKVIGSTLLLLGVLTVFLGWRAIAAEQRALREQIQSQGVSLAEAAAIFSIEPLLTLDDLVLDGYAQRLTRTQADIGFVRILNANGRVVAQAPGGAIQSVTDSASVRIFRASILVEPGDMEPIGTVEIGLLTRRADQAASSRVWWLALAFVAVFVILALTLSYLLKRIVTDPVRRLDRYAKALGQGDMDSAIVLSGGDELGRLAAALDAMRLDIRESHAALRRQEEYVASLVDSALEMILSVDRERRIVVFNPAAERSYGYAARGVRGRPAEMLYANPGEALNFFAAIREHGLFSGEILARRRDGSHFPVYLSGSLLRDRQGEVIGSLINARDITDEKRMAELDRARKSAEAANQAKSAFLAVMSHEIRSPMNGVIGMADLLAATGLTPEQRQYVEIILRSSHSLLALLNGILDFSKVEAGELKLEETPFDPRVVVGMACELHTATARRKGIELLHGVDEGVPGALLGDPLRLRQVLLNLIGNAVKFTGSGAVRVHVGVAREEETDPEFPVALHVAVADTGAGIAPDKQEIIFDRFSQADLSTTRRFGGVGLGLAISRQLVELMRGRIWVESEGLNRGSVFHFLVRFKPAAGVAPVPPETLPETSVPAPSPVESHPLRLLVVDDSPDNRTLAAHILRREGHTVTQAVDGTSALEALRREPFDMVLMDVQMPEMDGIVATRIIREGGVGMGAARIPILGVSAGAMREERERGLAVGMDDFLTKPYRARALLEAVRRLARSGRRRPVGLRGMESLAPSMVENQRLVLDRLAKALDMRDAQAVSLAAKGLREGVPSRDVRVLAVRIALAAQKDHLERARLYFERLRERLNHLTDGKATEGP